MFPKLEILESEEELRRLGEEWRSLLGRSGTNEPTLSPLWILSWWRTFGAHGGRRLAVGVFRVEGRLVGLAPLLRRTRWHNGILPLRRLEALASGEPEKDEVHSEYLSVLAERGAEEAVACTLASEVASGSFGPVDEAVIAAMSGEEPMARLLPTSFMNVGWRAEVEPMPGAPYLVLPRSWEEFLRLLRGHTRRHLTRSERDLESWAEGSLRLRVVEHASQLDEGFAILERLHTERWRAEGVSGAFASPFFRSFHKAVMPALLEADALELLWLEVKDEPVAVLYNIVWRNKVYQYQTGRRMGPRGWAYRPGAVIQAHAIRRAISKGRSEYDFLGGPARYKLELASATRPLTLFRASRPCLREGARRAVDAGWSLGRRLRAVWRARRAALDAEGGNDPAQG